MNIFSWFDTSDLPQSSIKKQIIDQSGHFVGGALIYLFFILGVINLSFWSIAVMCCLIFGLLSITKTPFKDGLYTKICFTAFISVMIAAMPFLLVFGNNLIWMVGLLSGLVIGFVREFYQHDSYKLSLTSAMDALFFGLGAMAIALVFFA